MQLESSSQAIGELSPSDMERGFF
ncbi:hypothetical protein MICAK_710008 [Microcystis aeruginosa PCC 9701]|uniref:Uncharacterized protein n=2 Tax=Microcystis aeruginosa TaxID=1126 RepID=I4IX64_MICAE|nr:hypothetical protein MICAK_710008 [Microcystis aeruginosa PCC 9701]